jgi:hypothetical protein
MTDQAATIDVTRSAVAAVCAELNRLEQETDASSFKEVIEYLRDSGYAVTELPNDGGYGLLAVSLTERGLRRQAVLEKLSDLAIEAQDCGGDA